MNKNVYILALFEKLLLEMLYKQKLKKGYFFNREQVDKTTTVQDRKETLVMLDRR